MRLGCSHKHKPYDASGSMRMRWANKHMKGKRKNTLQWREEESDFVWDQWESAVDQGRRDAKVRGRLASTGAAQEGSHSILQRRWGNGDGVGAALRFLKVAIDVGGRSTAAAPPDTANVTALSRPNRYVLMHLRETTFYTSRRGPLLFSHLPL